MNGDILNFDMAPLGSYGPYKLTEVHPPNDMLRWPVHRPWITSHAHFEIIAVVELDVLLIQAECQADINGFAMKCQNPNTGSVFSQKG